MNTLREQFMERLIREIFLHKGGGFVLKGGAALRTIYGEQRLTKGIDLDFTNPHRTANSLHNSISHAIDKAARGLRISDLLVSKPGKGEQSPKWKVNFKDANGETFHVEVEVSRDAKRAAPGKVVQAEFIPSAAPGIARFWVDIYEGSALAASKVAALLGRGLPRDLYDLDALKGFVEPPDPQQVRWAIERARLGDESPHEVLLDRLSALSWNRFQSELQNSLSPEIAERIDAAEWNSMIDRVGDYVSGLLPSVLLDH